jgi:hypothetical protein
MSAAFRSILNMTAEEAKEFCASNNVNGFTVYKEPIRMIAPNGMDAPNRAELEYYLDATDTYRVGKATIYLDNIQIAEVLPIPNFRPILRMTAEEATEFCTTNNFKPCIVYREPSHITTHSDKTVPNRVELDLYLDATDTHRVGKAIIYQDFIQVAVVQPDECDECGGECDGVHARMFAIHELLGMTDKDAKKYCASYKFQVYCLYGSPGLISVPKDIQNSSPDRIEIFVRKDADEFRVIAADLYNDGHVVNTLRPKASADDAKREKRVKELVDTILKNEQSIVEEVIRQMDAKRVTRIMDVLSVQDPDVVTEVVAKLKGWFTLTPASTYNSAEDMRKLWKSYGK